MNIVLLRRILLALTVSALATGVLVTLEGAGFQARNLAPLAVALVTGACYNELRVGRANRGLMLLSWGLWLCACTFGVLVAGIRTPILYGLPVTLMISALVQGGRATIGMTAATVIYLCALVAAETQGWLATPAPRSLLILLLVYATVSILAGALGVAVSNAQQQNLAKEKQFSEGLEENIRERTHLQEQFAALTAAMQGTETMEELSRTYLRHAVPAIGAQFAAFYLLREDTHHLEQVGGYGAVASDGLRRSFAVGDGLVGQCARDKQPVVIHTLPDTSIRIVSGIGSTVPRQLLLQALVQKGKVVGVLEFATLTTFNNTAADFLNQAMPTLAMSIEILDRSLRTQALLDAKREQATQLEQQQVELQDSFAKRDAANQALQAQVAELADARRAMLNIMEDLEMTRATENVAAHAGSTGAAAINDTGNALIDDSGRQNG